MKRLSRKKWQMIVLWMTIGMVAVMIASPAVAAEAGDGVVTTGEWNDSGEAADPPCGGKITSTDATWGQFGDYTAGTGTSTTVVYVGSTRATLTSDDPYWFSPLGSHDQPDCSDLPGQPVDATITVADVEPSPGDVDCTLTGTFNRNGVTVVSITATGTCTVSAPGPNNTTVSATSNVTHRWVLDLVAVPFVTPPNQIVGGTYNET